jgi:hypothetical protein
MDAAVTTMAAEDEELTIRSSCDQPEITPSTDVVTTIIEDVELLSESTPSTSFVVGDQIQVYWPDEDTFYGCQVTIVQERRGRRVFVEYDDGDKGWVTLDGSTSVRHDSRARQGKKTSAEVLQKLHKGCRIGVFNPFEKKYILATVKKIEDLQSDPHFVVYDNGRKHWTDLAMHQFYFEYWSL